MSMPLQYVFYAVAQDGQPADPNDVGMEENDSVSVERICGLYSDRFTMFGPQTEEGIKMEALVALAKFSRFIEEAKLTSQQAQGVNAVGVDGTVASFNELAQFIQTADCSNEVLTNHRNKVVQRIAKHFPFFANFKKT